MKPDRTLLLSGFGLFLVGLMAGLATGSVVNPRAGLAAHLEGVMNGAFLALVAVALPHLALSSRAAGWTKGLLLVGAWANFVGTSLTALTGASRMTPIAGAGHHGPEWAEMAVSVLLFATVPTMVPATVLLLWGAWGMRRE